MLLQMATLRLQSFSELEVSILDVALQSLATPYGIIPIIIRSLQLLSAYSSTAAQISRYIDLRTIPTEIRIYVPPGWPRFSSCRKHEYLGLL